MSSFAATSIARHPPAVILRTDSSARDAIKMMAEKSVRHAIVSNDGRKIDGIVSAKDILNYLGGGEKYKIVETSCSCDILVALGSSIDPIINRKPVIASTTASLPDMMNLMSKHDIGMLPLLDENGIIWGSLSERHLFKLFEENQMFVRVFEIMSKPLITLDSKATLLDTMRVMIKNDIRRIPIMHEGALWGIITVKDVIKFLASPYVDEAINKGLCDYLFTSNVSKIASQNPKTVGPDEDLCDAVKKMNSFNVGSLIVMSGGKPVGMLTERDFLLKLPKLRGVEFITDVSKNRVLVGRIHF
ncbi:MAG: CBS domain-containing protein [Candidatus Methanomethylicaceae archaeon]